MSVPRTSCPSVVQLTCQSVLVTSFSATVPRLSSPSVIQASCPGIAASCAPSVPVAAARSLRREPLPVVAGGCPSLVDGCPSHARRCGVTVAERP